LQRRFVKELRLRNISTIAEANAYVPEFIARYNDKFAKLPLGDCDAHRRNSKNSMRFSRTSTNAP